jgi:hypothetical protein
MNPSSASNARVRRYELASELIALMEPRLRYVSPSSFVQEEALRAADHFAMRLDVFIEALKARAPQPNLPRLEAVPPPLPAWALCPVNVVESGTAQNPVVLVSEDDSDDEKSRSRQRQRRQPQAAPRHAPSSHLSCTFTRPFPLLLSAFFFTGFLVPGHQTFW